VQSLGNLRNIVDYSHRLSDDIYFADLRKNCQVKPSNDDLGIMLHFI
ncbi:MAG: hypothetical protein RL761_304, partial [Pseudomonadota bacterium]